MVLSTMMAQHQIEAPSSPSMTALTIQSAAQNSPQMDKSACGATAPTASMASMK
ncbi:hypothetical protein N8D56_08680 [Devosia sp. A8/3-2]|nr:hypothetical protein N8D56_08680 [Devosia sp. A8/3-2]